MIARVVAIALLVAALVGAGLWIGKRNARRSLPPMKAHCGSGIGGMAMCTEWSDGDPRERQYCDKLQGTWADGPCPSDVSNAGGTCVMKTPTHTGVMHYASGWRGHVAPHCERHGGSYAASP